MRRDERGYIVVETIGSFLLLVLLVTSILSLINIVVVQARVHYALTQTAQAISMYDYVLDVTGAAEHITNSAEQAEAAQAEIDAFKSNVNGLLDGVEALDAAQVGQYGDALVGQVEDVASDPKKMVQEILNYGVNNALGAGTEALLRPLMGRYLANGEMSGDEFLKAFHVIGGLEGLDFYSLDDDIGNDSAFLTADGDVKLAVQYDIDYSFGALMIPFEESKLHITQEVMTKAWLGGKGEGYQAP